MLVISIIVGLGILGAMAYLALSPKTPYGLRIAALIALGVMILSVIICLIIMISGRSGTANIVPDVPLMPADKNSGANNLFLILGFIIFLLALFIVIFIFSLRESRNRKK